MLLGLRTILSLADFIELPVNDILRLHGRGLGGESQLDGHVLLSWQLIEDVVLDVDGLSGSSGAAEQQRNLVVDGELEDMRIPH